VHAGECATVRHILKWKLRRFEKRRLIIYVYCTAWDKTCFRGLHSLTVPQCEDVAENCEMILLMFLFFVFTVFMRNSTGRCHSESFLKQLKSEVPRLNALRNCHGAISPNSADPSINCEPPYAFGPHLRPPQLSKSNLHRI